MHSWFVKVIQRHREMLMWETGGELSRGFRLHKSLPYSSSRTCKVTRLLVLSLVDQHQLFSVKCTNKPVLQPNLCVVASFSSKLPLRHGVLQRQPNELILLKRLLFTCYNLICFVFIIYTRWFFKSDPYRYLGNARTYSNKWFRELIWT